MTFFTTDADWNRRCGLLVQAMVRDLAQLGLTPDRFGLVALRDAGAGMPQGFSYRGDWRCYPCSIVKAFHLVHALHAIDQGQVQAHAELSRAMRDMIYWSSNTATNYVIDIITGTTGDTLLHGAEFEAWRQKREGLNQFFRRLGWPEFEGCNISQKLMDDVRYGREAQYAGASGEYLNVLTPLAGARLFHEVFSETSILSGPAQSEAQAVLRRDWDFPGAELPHYQMREYLAEALPRNAAIWSKAGHNNWTGDERTSHFKHDLIRIALPGAAPVIISFMTQGRALSDDHPEAFAKAGALIAAHLLG